MSTRVGIFGGNIVYRVRGGTTPLYTAGCQENVTLRELMRAAREQGCPCPPKQCDIRRRHIRDMLKAERFEAREKVAIARARLSPRNRGNRKRR